MIAWHNAEVALDIKYTPIALKPVPCRRRDSSAGQNPYVVKLPFNGAGAFEGA